MRGRRVCTWLDGQERFWGCSLWQGTLDVFGLWGVQSLRTEIRGTVVGGLRLQAVEGLEPLVPGGSNEYRSRSFANHCTLDVSFGSCQWLRSSVLSVFAGFPASGAEVTVVYLDRSTGAAAEHPFVSLACLPVDEEVAINKRHGTQGSPRCTSSFRCARSCPEAGPFSWI